MSAIQLPTPKWREDEELEIFDRSVREFFLREATPEKMAKWREAGVVDRDMWTKAGEAGLLCVAGPEEYGGAGGDFRHDAVIINAMAEMGVEGFGLSLHNAIVAPYLWHYGTKEQKERWLPRMATGELVGGIAMTEPGAGSDLQGIKTTARQDGNHYVVNGSKTFITNGQTANLILVVAKTDPTQGAKGTSLIVVETDAVDGFRRGRNLDKVGQDAQDTSELFFEDVRVPASNVLGGDEGRGFIQLMQQLASERLQIAMQGVGMMERALSQTAQYVKERHAFGKPLIDFQNTQFKLAECKTKATVAKVFVDHCIERLLKGDLDAATASMAKYWVTDVQCEVIDECLQLHGGWGYMNEMEIGRMYRDARVQRIYGGANEIMKVL
ncbi:MAG: acyl-CoA dehydrogenase family protein, partial [Hyphomonadaceae bacterium]|nr:acyl-CoA dehydrogenase family protein [Hyphomonadaceae bacterium]